LDDHPLHDILILVWNSYRSGVAEFDTRAVRQPMAIQDGRAAIPRLKRHHYSIGDLLVDYADFRHLDAMSSTSHQLDHFSALAYSTTTGAEFEAVRDLAGLIDRFQELDVHALARLGRRWVQQLDGHIDRRALLLKLSAGLTLAAATPALTTVAAEPPQAVTPSIEDDKFAGIWRSRYVYYSSGREKKAESEHYVVFRYQNRRLVGQSLPNSLDSRVRLDLSVDGSIATGTWSERTSPSGYYKGAIYHGSIQLLIDPYEQKHER
jgi:hypothetical protein